MDDNWTIIGDMKIGYLQPKYQLMNMKTHEVVIFKPTTTEAANAECIVPKIAKALGIEAVKNEPFALVDADGQEYNGIISPDFKFANRKNKFIPAGKFFQKENGQLTLSRFDDAENRLKHVPVTMEVVREKLPEIEKDVVNMVFLDVLTKNTDRHNANWELAFDMETNKFTGLSPIFDFDRTFSKFSDESKFVWSKQSLQPTFDELYCNLCEHYPEQVSELMKKTNDFLQDTGFKEKYIEINTFLSARFESMRQIFKDALISTRPDLVCGLKSYIETVTLPNYSDDIDLSKLNLDKPDEISEIISALGDIDFSDINVQQTAVENAKNQIMADNNNVEFPSSETKKVALKFVNRYENNSINTLLKQTSEKSASKSNDYQYDDQKL